MMLTMSETATQDGLPLDMRSALDQGQYHGAAKDSPLYHYQLQKLSVEKQLWQLRRMHG